MVLDEAFEVHDVLNPLLWDKDNRLLPEVKSKILDIVQQFLVMSELDLHIIDITLVGSNASYNYTTTSDLDVHLVVNYEEMNASDELLTVLFNQLRSKFNSTYDITIHGIEVELYIEDVNVSATTNGIYSVLYDKWIKFPKKLTDIPVVDLSKELSYWVPKIEAIISGNNEEAIRQMVDTLYLIRKNSIANEGEFGKGNQLFKEIRRAGLLQKLKDAYHNAISDKLSLESLNKATEGEELDEASKNQLISQSKATADGKKRYKNRVKSKIVATVKQYNSIDMNKLFKDNILTVDIDVQGETDKYVVKISFGGFLDILHDQLKQSGKDVVDLKMITRALITGFNRNDVYIHCSCPDFRYTYSYYATKNDINSGEPENEPSDERNPDDSKGSGCKHILLVLSNTSWIIKVASVINNYIKYMKKHYQKLYQEIIYPAIYQKEYSEETEEVSDK